MKKLIKVYSLPIALILCISSCGGNRQQNVEADSTLADTVGHVQRCIEYFNDPEGEVVKPVYSSAVAIAAPDYSHAEPFNGPFGLVDYRTDMENHIDLYPYREAGGIFYLPHFSNLSDDTVHVKEMHFEDNRLDAYWRGNGIIDPDIFACGPWLRVDSVFDKDNYKMVLVYENDQYPPQTFYINFHSKAKTSTE